MKFAVVKIIILENITLYSWNHITTIYIMD